LEGEGKVKKAVLVCVLTATVAACAPAVSAADEGTAFGYPLAPGTFASAITVGPDNNIWFTGGPGIGKVTPDGKVTEYPAPGAGASIVSGPDGNLWFVEPSANAIGRSTTTGEIASFPLPAPKSDPTAIAVGPDGNLWFTEGAAGRVGRITASGEIGEFALPPGRHPGDIAAGPDGNLWFTDRGANWIGRISTSGQVSQFPVPGPLSKISSIAAGPDGNLWFAEEAAPKVGRITPGGQVTQFVVPTEGGTESIVSGPGGQLWFGAGFEVGAISPLGAISWPACLAPYCEVPPVAMAVGSDGNLWVAAGVGHCPSYCGGGTEQSYLFRPGGIGRYALPPLTLAIGPRASPVRHRTARVTIACGLAEGCRGILRLGTVEYRGGARRLRVLARGAYDLAAGEARSVRVHVSRWAVEYLHDIASGSLRVRALAGPKGHIQAIRGPIALRLGSRSGRH
jgi:virginiamycin B lyase